MTISTSSGNSRRGATGGIIFLPGAAGVEGEVIGLAGAGAIIGFGGVTMGRGGGVVGIGAAGLGGGGVAGFVATAAAAGWDDVAAGMEGDGMEDDTGGLGCGAGALAARGLEPSSVRVPLGTATPVAGFAAATGGNGRELNVTSAADRDSIGGAKDWIGPIGSLTDIAADSSKVLTLLIKS